MVIIDFLVCLTRDLRESRQRYESMVNELKRKDSIMREMQQRLETSEGCKFYQFTCRRDYVIFTVCVMMP